MRWPFVFMDRRTLTTALFVLLAAVFSLVNKGWVSGFSLYFIHSLIFNRYAEPLPPTILCEASQKNDWLTDLFNKI